MRNLIYILALGALAAGLMILFWPKAPQVANYPSAGTDLIAFGDSLVYGTGSSGGGFVRDLSQTLGKPIVNLGVPGDTTADGLARLSELDAYRPKVVLLLFGGNDYLRKVPREQTFANLANVIENIQSRGAVVLLLGVRGGLLQDNFASDYQTLANTHRTAFVPNVLEGLLGDSAFMSDQIHPNDAGYARIAARIAPILQKLLQ